MVTRHWFDRELEELHLDLVRMAGMVEESIESTIIALKKQDVELAQKIFRNDDIIDEMEQRIEKRCLMLIARQQPLAKDLRTISTALKIITDMERIADHSADIAEITIRMARQRYIKPIIDLPKMAELAKKMVQRSIDAYIRQDMQLAHDVCESDNEVDDLFFKIVFELTSLIKNDTQTAEQAIDLMFVAKYLERMADHATNIGEWVIFNVTGEHEHLATQLHRDDHKNNPFIEEGLLD